MRRYIITHPKFSRCPEEITTLDELRRISWEAGNSIPDFEVVDGDGIYYRSPEGERERVAIEEEPFFRRLQAKIGTAIPEDLR